MVNQPSSSEPAPVPAAAPTFFRRFLVLLKASGPTIFSLLLFAAAVWALRHALHQVRLEDVVAEMRAQTPWRVAGAISLALLSYLALTFYDYLGVVYLEHRIGYAKVALASFIGYAFTNAVGHTVLVGAPIRYRLYSAWGLSVLEVGKLMLYVTSLYWIAFVTLAGLVFSLEPAPLPAGLHLPFASTRSLGVICLATSFVVLGLMLLVRKPFPLRGFMVRMPQPRLLALQLAVAVCEWACASSVLFLLLPSGLVGSWWTFLAIYMLAQLAGLASQVPGGLGVFETAMLLLVAPANPAPLLGAMVLFRAVYYLLPLLLALLLLLGREITTRRSRRAL